MLNTIIPNTSINDLQKNLFIQTKFRMGKEDYSDIELLKTYPYIIMIISLYPVYYYLVTMIF